MTKNDLKKIIIECVNETLMESKIQDPTKEEMMDYLRSIYGNEEGFDDSAEVAIYWFADLNHGGQSSNLYSVLSTSPFRPGRISRGPEEGSMEEMMYNDLESEFGSGGKEEVDENDINKPNKSVYPLDFKNVVNYIRITNKPETGETVVAWIQNGRFNDKLSYYTNDKKDAYDTFNLMKKQVDKSNGNMPLRESPEMKMDKISNQEKNKIGTAFRNAGLDGNGRFVKKEQALSAVTDILSNCGFSLDMVSSDMIMGDKGSRNFIFRRSNKDGQDPFTQQPEIRNSRVVFTWDKLEGIKFEVIVYLS